MAYFTGNLILVQFSTAMITHYSLVSFFIIEYFQSSVCPMTNNKCQMGALINPFERGITIKTPGIRCLQLTLFKGLTCYKK